MSTEEQLLWDRINTFELDDPSSTLTFTKRLARENAWSISYTEKAIEEYKKFIFLCCITETGVTPSDQVDQVWHLHLTYTKSYWTDLCKNILSKEIHHNPTKGGNSEGQKFDGFYTDTLQLYKDKFKLDPPKLIWPENDKRFSDINFQRVNLKKYYLLRKPLFDKKYFSLFILLGLSMLFIQAHSFYGSLVKGILAIVAIVFIVIIVRKNGGGGTGGSGCSSGGCSSGHSGCSSGCSGCGGGCGGGD